MTFMVEKYKLFYKMLIIYIFFTTVFYRNGLVTQESKLWLEQRITNYHTVVLNLSAFTMCVFMWSHLIS